MITFGADPELFVKDNKTFVSAETKERVLVRGTKKNPFEVKGGATQVDGVAAEFNILPAKDEKEFYDNIVDVVGNLKKQVKIFNEDYSLCPSPTATFSKDYFNSLPEHTKLLGCEPDFNAYTEKVNEPPFTKEPFRTGAGHVHVGWINNVDPFSEGHLYDCRLVVKELDKYLFPLSMYWDADEKRRKLYGAKGSFRPKSFGVEYRPLSNAWLKNSSYVSFVFKVTQAVLEGLDKGKLNTGLPAPKLKSKNVQDAFFEVMSNIKQRSY